MTTADWYRHFGEVDAPAHSAIYADWAVGAAGDDRILALLAELPRTKQQPNLLFACARLLGSPEGAFEPWRDWLLENWETVRAQMLVRSTQTNEPRRCALLVPVLAAIGGPLALLEVGASAGLCLYPDRYSYSYDGRRIDPARGPSTVLLECATTGNPPIPSALPEIVWRAGIDLNPLSLTNDDDTTWLETLVWPEQHERRERIRAAAEIVRSDPPRIVKGDATEALPGVAAEAPDGAALVIVTSAAIVYLTPENRSRFIETVESLEARWISHEGRGIVPTAAAQLVNLQPPEPDEFVLALDGDPLAWSGPHGQRLDWIAATAPS